MTSAGLNSYAAACALLMQESSGGHNEYGHDAGMPFEGAGKVTETNYAEYVAERDATDPPRCQGVGPTQLTWIGYQDQADALRGCWHPLSNMTVGFTAIARFKAAGLTWHSTWLRYSGGKEDYADAMDALFVKWQGLLNPLETP
jgi:hypothetical protein